MEVEFTCTYCGKEWTDHVWSMDIDKECPVCKDSNLKARPIEQSKKIDYYATEKELQKKK